jgi:nucleotide-binding universal stress UspA family protein
MSGGRIVVGVTGSEASTCALVWALEVAHGQDWTLDIVTAWPDRGLPMLHEVPGHYNDARGRAVAGLNQALARCGVELDGPTVRVWVDNADPLEALTARCVGADLLVLGVSRVGVPRSRTVSVDDLSVTCPTVVVDAAGHDTALTG